MKVAELRAALAAYDAETLREIVVMLYKAVPKGKKESDGLDEIIQDFSKDKAKKKDKAPQWIDFPSLESEVEEFIGLVAADCYFAPNRYVNKSKRSKWRFEVKRFIKALLDVRGEDGEKAARLLAKIYEMLSYGCNYYIFTSDNPFAAVGYEQPELLRLVLGKLFFSGVDRATMKEAVFLTLDSNVDRETLHIQLQYVLLNALKTADAKELAFEQCAAFREGYDDFQAAKERFRYSTKYDDYRKEARGNNAVELYLIIKFSLHEYDDGIKYFWKNYIERDKEITLYILLDYYLSEEGFEDLWIREYERMVAKRVEPREYLQEEYAERKRKQEDIAEMMSIARSDSGGQEHSERDLGG